MLRTHRHIMWKDGEHYWFDNVFNYPGYYFAAEDVQVLLSLQRLFGVGAYSLQQ